MPLKIVEAWERPPVDQIVVLLYGLPATGKTTTAYSSRNPLLLDFDQGADRAANITKSVVIQSWQDVSGIEQSDLEGIDTVVVDTLGAAQDMLTLDVIRKNPRHGRDGQLTLQGYGALKARFTRWLAHLKAMGKDIVLIAHTEEEKRGDGEEKDQRITMIGGSKDYVLRASDVIGRLTLFNNRRQLSFEPTDRAIGKNPGRLQAMPIPSEDAIGGFLDEVIRKTKERMNAERTKHQESLREARAAAATSFDAEVASATKETLRSIRARVARDHSVGEEERIRRATKVKAHADAQGWVWDNELTAYVDASSAAGETEAEREAREEREAIIAADDPNG